MVKLSNIDFFRKVPVDLTQTTRRGGILSIGVATVIGLVLFLEIWTYFVGETKAHLVLDANSDSKLDINFEISFYELPCRYATVELWDYLGKNKLDVSSHIRKTVIRGDEGEQRKHDYHDQPAPVAEKIDHENDRAKDIPVQIAQLSSSNYGGFLKDHEYTFVLYYVDVCYSQFQPSTLRRLSVSYVLLHALSFSVHRLTSSCLLSSR